MLLLLFWSLSLVAANKPSPVTGTWEGESLCTVPDSPCHNEHVIYEIAPDPNAGGKLKIDAYKIVNGEKQFMGALGCTFDDAKNVLSCNYRADDDWTFVLNGDRLTGELHIRQERLLYRKIDLHRK
ncbi:MAG TPA: hypothetical protein VN577_00170 [Terriglobales bacterium]|nr:hypothetical protein [Terriglobales bacterium]